jgi:hypothetical protein
MMPVSSIMTTITTMTTMNHAHAALKDLEELSLSCFALRPYEKDCIHLLYQKDIEDTFSIPPVELEPRLPEDFYNCRFLHSDAVAEKFGIPMVFFSITHKAAWHRQTHSDYPYEFVC